MKDTFRGCGGHVQNFRSSGVGTGGDPTHRLTCRGDPLIVYAGHRNESPGRRDPKELSDPTRNPSFLGGVFCFQKLDEKILGPGLSTPWGEVGPPPARPPQKGAGGGVSGPSGKVGERGQGGRSGKERENLTITTIKTSFVEL